MIKKTKKSSEGLQGHEIILYQDRYGKVEVEVKFDQETVWLNQKDIANLFGVNIPAISKHIENIFQEGELLEKATISKMEIVQTEGNREVKRYIDIYNLDMIIAIGYRVNSSKAISSWYFGEQPHPTSPNREECLLETSLLGEETKVRLLKKEKINFIEYNRSIIDYAKQNRKKSTKVEEIFWNIVKDRKFLGYKFKRQKVVGSFILDFYCSELLLGIELDGGYHNERKDYDIMRDSEIYKKGILVMRFKNEDIEKNLSGVISELEESIKKNIRKSIRF